MFKNNKITKLSALSLFMVIFLSSQFIFSPTIHAATEPVCNNNQEFMGIPAWYKGLLTGSGDNCNVVNPAKYAGGMQAFILRIIENVTDILLHLFGYLCIVYIVYGGFRILTAGGSSDRVSAGIKTIYQAAIGALIGFSAGRIIQTIREATLAAGSDSSGTVLFSKLLDLAYSAAAVTAVIMIIIAGYAIITGGGSPEKIQKARKRILYAVSGLILVLLAYAITKYIYSSQGLNDQLLQ